MATKHILLMLACCLIPLTALGAGAVLGLPANAVFYFGMVVLCPLLHLLMMRTMMRHNHKPSEQHHLSPTQWNISESESHHS